METYRKKLVMRIVIQVILLLAVSIFIGFALSRYGMIGEEQTEGSFFQGFQIGLFFSWLIIMVIGIVSCIRALKSEEYLRKKYIREHDERKVRIHSESRSNAYWISLYGILTASVISGFYNYTVFFTLLGVILFMGAIGIGAKIFYHKVL